MVGFWLRFPRIFSIKKGSIVFRGYVKNYLIFFCLFLVMFLWIEIYHGIHHHQTQPPFDMNDVLELIPTQHFHHKKSKLMRAFTNDQVPGDPRGRKLAGLPGANQRPNR